ncbi:MAG: hypothetical protein D6760_08635 [Deltaproteobacteria bacterium]|nr:MAG: hypothetical protein D6760_08635 [Deltaproteobacteria bacterium]
MKTWFSLSVLFVVVFVGLGHTARAAEDKIPEPKAIWIAGVPNAVQVGNVVISGQPSAEALGLLKMQGYKTVVSTRAPGELNWDEAAEAAKAGLKFISIPMPSPVTEISDEQVAKLAEAMEKAERPMLLHCGSGNRIAGLWAVYLAEHEGVPADRALALAEKAGMRSVRAAVEKRLRSKR